VGNRTLTPDLPERTPCVTCRHFEGWTFHLSPLVECGYRKIPMVAWKDGCRWWEREPGADDEDHKKAPAGPKARRA
jgi:hypothetical protein